MDSCHFFYPSTLYNNQLLLCLLYAHWSSSASHCTASSIFLPHLCVQLPFCFLFPPLWSMIGSCPPVLYHKYSEITHSDQIVCLQLVSDRALTHTNVLTHLETINEESKNKVQWLWCAVWHGCQDHMTVWKQLQNLLAGRTAKWCIYLFASSSALKVYYYITTATCT